MADYNSSGKARFPYNINEDGRRQVNTTDHNPPIINPEFVIAVSETFDELKQLLIKKHLDYGPKNISQSPGGPLNGLRVRMHDKSARINNLIDKGIAAENEPLEDSFKDIANYGVIAMMVLRGKWPND